MPLPIEFEILPCELDVPFQGTPHVHVGNPQVNFGGPLSHDEPAARVSKDRHMFRVGLVLHIPKDRILEP